MREINSEIISWNTVEVSPDKLTEMTGRPNKLSGTTYKIKPGEHAMYITINDIVLNPGTEHEETRPFEIFINSKDTGSRQWSDALTRVMSAVFRKGGQWDFLIEELKVISDPSGGRFHKGKYITSLVAEIGYVLEEHMNSSTIDIPPPLMEELAEDIENATTCKKCGARAVVPKDGCPTCLACGDSKCG